MKKKKMILQCLLLVLCLQVNPYGTAAAQTVTVSRFVVSSTSGSVTAGQYHLDICTGQSSTVGRSSGGGMILWGGYRPGSCSATSVDSVLLQTVFVPSEFRLFQNYPNPFNPSTAIEFELPTASHAVLSIYNTRGELVETLLSGNLPAGRHRCRWEAGSSPCGVYVCVLSAGNVKQVKKLVLMK